MEIPRTGPLWIRFIKCVTNLQINNIINELFVGTSVYPVEPTLLKIFPIDKYKDMMSWKFCHGVVYYQ